MELGFVDGLKCEDLGVGNSGFIALSLELSREKKRKRLIR